MMDWCILFGVFACLVGCNLLTLGGYKLTKPEFQSLLLTAGAIAATVISTEGVVLTSTPWQLRLAVCLIVGNGVWLTATHFSRLRR